MSSWWIMVLRTGSQKTHYHAFPMEISPGTTRNWSFEHIWTPQRCEIVIWNYYLCFNQSISTRFSPPLICECRAASPWQGGPNEKTKRKKKTKTKQVANWSPLPVSHTHRHTRTAQTQRPTQLCPATVCSGRSGRSSNTSPLLGRCRQGRKKKHAADSRGGSHTFDTGTTIKWHMSHSLLAPPDRRGVTWIFGRSERISTGNATGPTDGDSPSTDRR